MTAPFLDRYGWHGDELYFIAASRHLAFGYVDFPPVVPLLAAADQALFPRSLVALRLLALVTGAVVVVLTALIARELGASSRAPQGMNPSTVVMINFTLDEGNKLFSDCRQVATVTNSVGIHNNDYGAPILICTNPRQPLWKVWPGLQLLD